MKIIEDKMTGFSASKLEWLMGFAEQAAKASPDQETKVGSVLIRKDNGAIVATGFNGFARKANDKVLPKVRPDKHKYIIHSESNLLSNCLRNNIPINNGIVFCTLSPCVNCMRLLWQAGITEVIVRDLYREFNISEIIDIIVEVNQLKDTKYYYIKYNPCT